MVGGAGVSILLIDLSSIWYPAWHSTADQEVSAAFERTVAKVHSLASGHDHVAVCVDAPPYLRGELLPTYKAQRVSLPPQAIEQFTRTKERLVKDGFLLWAARGFEADDVIATAAWQLAEAGNERPIVIASGDKDLMVIVDDARHRSVLSPASNVLYDEAKVIEKFGVHPGQLADLLALWGDASDNIPGIPGIGPKKAAQLLAEFGTLEGVLTHGDDIPGVMGERVKTHQNAARLARKVIELRTDVPIDVTEIFKERQPEKLPTRSYELENDDDLDEAMGPAMVKTQQGPGPQEPDRDVETKPDPRVALAKFSPTTAIAPVQFEHGLEPSSMGAAWQLAKGVFQSRLYPQLATPEAVWAIIIRGREMGLGALTALDTIVMIKGKPALSAHLIVARAKMHPMCEYFQLVSSDDQAAEWVCQRKGNPEPTRMRYTIQQAHQAGLRDGNWATRPAEMIRKTASVQLARVEFPEASQGIFSVEELEGT